MLGFLLKGQCLAPNAYNGPQYSDLCYNDIQPLFSIRAIQTDTFPYIDGEFTADQQLVGGAIEYPVLTGIFMWIVGLLVDEGNAYLRVTALMLAPFALVSAYLLARMSGRQALLFAASPAVVFYAFHNWDLLVVGATVAGLWSWWRGKPIWAAVWFGVGAALKLNPILFVLPLALERLHAKGRREAGLVLGAGVGTAVGLNLPFMLINFKGWWATYEFHRVRVPNFDSIWNLASSRYPWGILHMPTLNLTVAVLTLATFVVVLAYGWQRARREGVYPFLGASAALLATFMLWNKVHSPQYTLWLIPFFVVLNISWLWWAAYTIIDAVAYVGIFRWFYDIVYVGEVDWTAAKWAMVTSVWARALLLLVLVVVFVRANPVRGPDELDVAAPT
jgi:uncharacterized membrane protein